MTRTRTAAGLIALLLATTACTGEDEPEGDGARTDPPATAPASTEPPQPGDPVSWGSSGGSCTELAGPTVIWEWIQVARPLTLRSVTPVGVEGGFEPGRASIVAVPKGAVPFTGSVRGTRIPERYAADVAWHDRAPVPGFTVDRGRYYVFLEASVTGDAGYDGLDLAWTDETGAEGTSTWDVQDRYRRDCGG